MKKILYIHGFCSSAQTATVGRLREVFGGTCQVHAIDVNHHPAESIGLIEAYVAEHGIDLLLGSRWAATTRSAPVSLAPRWP